MFGEFQLSQDMHLIHLNSHQKVYISNVTTLSLLTKGFATVRVKSKANMFYTFDFQSGQAFLDMSNWENKVGWMEYHCV